MADDVEDSEAVCFLFFGFFFFVCVLLARAANCAMVLKAPSSEWNSREWRERGAGAAGRTISAS